MSKAKKLSSNNSTTILNDPIQNREMLLLLDKLEAIEEQLEQWEIQRQMFS